ncbi:hypothetical protein HQ945_08260 [Phyllobacterium sp. BT25]|uniref:Uncharacterized protein n=1 Tax=Phyllobacterium pellucidum TaxID=2740464 RepID=A0A849VP83_9HYPH|nr:hypothetical protein [Phyllobacterium pellucidum]NTS31246.1 hypothetical protein [Phyllobacterium pellucidum]
MSTILALFSGSNGIIAGIATLIAAIGAAYLKGRSAERTKQKAKEKDAYERHLKDIADAADARNHVQPSDSVQNDKYRRD